MTARRPEGLRVVVTITGRAAELMADRGDSDIIEWMVAPLQRQYATVERPERHVTSTEDRSRREPIWWALCSCGWKRVWSNQNDAQRACEGHKRTPAPASTCAQCGYHWNGEVCTHCAHVKEPTAPAQDERLCGQQFCGQPTWTCDRPKGHNSTHIADTGDGRSARWEDEP